MTHTLKGSLGSEVSVILNVTFAAEDEVVVEEGAATEVVFPDSLSLDIKNNCFKPSH